LQLGKKQEVTAKPGKRKIFVPQSPAFVRLIQKLLLSFLQGLGNNFYFFFFDFFFTCNNNANMSSDDEYDMMYDSEGDADIGGSDNGSEQSGSEEEDPEVEVENKYFEAKGKYLCCNCLSYS